MTANPRGSASAPKPVEQPLDAAIDDYLGWATVHAFKPGSGTPRTYRIKLGMYAAKFGPGTPVLRVTGQQWFRTCDQLWATKSPETYNSGRRAALSFLKFCRDCEPPLTEAEPPKLWVPRKVPSDRSRALPEATVATFMDLVRYPLREVTLWSLLYDSSERLSAVLSLNIENMDLEMNVAKVRIKGGDTRYIAWTPATSLMLRAYIGDRGKGPLFLGEVQPWNWRNRPVSDAGPGGLYRLTAHRARIIFKEKTGIARPHRIRHSRLTHLGGIHGTNSAMLKAISGHLTDKQLGEYSKPGPEQIAAFMAQVAEQMGQ
jgi:integrase